ncbi:sensor histidine kinase [Corynebacterium aquatimens]|uniref:histidine kinase n=1 Tax=Corynebacterium aquatimens TaxID=1190508 RepID=A0A931DZZ7_9CORY|nr:HAMP domain-containing sensor histidine kinase [Corynebacterium aquatimens]MBG6121327.1 two-component system sensor histidine kinase VanS [Corynebacterium aquatimens]WJY66126.1 putative sensor histidine kinase TcrY [Corynebacterium aquatimens]
MSVGSARRDEALTGSGNRLSLRARVTLLFVATVLVVGLSLTAIVYLYLRLTPVPFTAVFPGAPAPGSFDGPIDGSIDVPIDGPIDGSVDGGGVPADDAVIDAAVPFPDALLRVVVTSSLVTLLFMTALSGIIGWFAAGYALRPVRGMADVARGVSAGDMSHRINYSGPADDIGDLAVAFDAMLESVESHVESQRRFAANASHELKTPIATIQTMADVALSDPDATTDELRETLTRVREVTAHNGEMVSALLAFSQATTGRIQRQTVDLSALFRDSASAHSIPAVVPNHPITVSGDAILLHHAVDNLFANAASHGTAGTARAELSTGDSGPAVITVSNDGPVLETAVIAQLTEPFTRAQSRVGDRGHGLGLALVDAIGTAHNGALTLSGKPGGGLIASLQLPTRD